MHNNALRDVIPDFICLIPGLGSEPTRFRPLSRLATAGNGTIDDRRSRPKVPIDEMVMYTAEDLCSC
jgi:hypothetical protein